MKIIGFKKVFGQRLAKLSAGIALSIMVAGCQTGDQFTGANPVKQPAVKAADIAEPITLREGDVLKISFPGSANLDTTTTIRRDGKISLPLIGEVKANGLTPLELQNQLLNSYSNQLVSKQVMVEVVSSTFTIYITGAVLRPGKISSNRSLTALEAIMEAGGFDYTKADLKDVTVVRQENNGTKKYILNLKTAMEGGASQPFNLKPDDIIYVPEKFNWF
ncbi:MAG TPA: polysaccharide biosynthesis/export family protein [Verrucomicrobiae bacterium]|nr:polysaccharide biosynthesis/export family protein [Verrucomicrobiae bacterium]